jgi:hypothetical protein
MKEAEDKQLIVSLIKVSFLARELLVERVVAIQLNEQL